jgi:hypothetical protein
MSETREQVIGKEIRAELNDLEGAEQPTLQKRGTHKRVTQQG